MAINQTAVDELGEAIHGTCGDIGTKFSADLKIIHLLYGILWDFRGSLLLFLFNI